MTHGLRARRRAAKRLSRPHPTNLSHLPLAVSRSAEAVMTSRTRFSVRPGTRDRIRAAAAATWGVADDVPLKLVTKLPGPYPAAPPMSVVAILTPGASRLNFGPKQLPHQFSPSFEVGDFRSSHGLDAPTVSTSGRVAGYWIAPLLFPAAITTTEPLVPRPLVRARSSALVVTPTGGPPPHEFDSTSALASFHAQSIASAVLKSSNTQPSLPSPLAMRTATRLHIGARPGVFESRLRMIPPHAVP